MSDLTKTGCKGADPLSYSLLCFLVFSSPTVFIDHRSMKIRAGGGRRYTCRQTWCFFCYYEAVASFAVYSGFHIFAK